MELKALRRVFKTALTLITLLAVDILVYGEIFPLIGLFCGIWFSSYFGLPLVAEVFIVAGSTMLLFFVSLGLRVEVHFWRKLYRLENLYKYVLYIRDSVNAVFLAVFTAELVSTSYNAFGVSSASSDQNKETESQSPENSDPLEGFVFILCQRLDLYRLQRFVNCCFSDTPEVETRPQVEHEAKMLHACAFVVTCITKMLYFNTLFTYLNAVEMFSKMQSTAQRVHQRTPSGRRHVRRRTRPGGQETNNMPPVTTGVRVIN